VSRRILLAASALCLVSGCATETATQKPAAPAPGTTVSPTQPPAAPAPSKASPGAMRPEVPAAEEQRLLESARQNIGDVTKAVAELEGRPLKAPQQETLKTAKNFLDQARSALDQRDYQRAANLASKARALTDDLAGATK
jgi:flagellar basal body L-ring protein FlgH